MFREGTPGSDESKDALVFLARRALETDPAASPSEPARVTSTPVEVGEQGEETSTRVEVSASRVAPDEERIRAVASGVEALGYRRADARERARAAWETLSGRLGRAPSEPELLAEALRGPS